MSVYFFSSRDAMSNRSALAAVRQLLLCAVVVGPVLVAADDGVPVRGDNGFYFGSSLGHFGAEQLTIDGPGNVQLAPAGGASEPLQSSWKMFSGYKFNQFFAAEASWIDLQDLDVGLPARYRLDESSYDSDTDAFSVVAVGRLPVYDNLSLSAKAGLFRWDTTLTNRLQGSNELREEGMDHTFGLGAQYELSDKFSISAEWERFNNISETDIDFMSIGIRSRF